MKYTVILFNYFLNAILYYNNYHGRKIYFVLGLAYSITYIAVLAICHWLYQCNRQCNRIGLHATMPYRTNHIYWTHRTHFQKHRDSQLPKYKWLYQCYPFIFRYNHLIFRNYFTANDEIYYYNTLRTSLQLHKSYKRINYAKQTELIFETDYNPIIEISNLVPASKRIENLKAPIT